MTQGYPADPVKLREKQERARALGFANRRHGLRGTGEYEAWENARQRCMNPRHPAYPRYGGRGIQFRFTSFEEFFATLGERPDGMTLDRINNDGHYEPNNVRWATPSEQAFNRTHPRWKVNK